MKRYDKLIFVSNTDTCLGPMAKFIMKSKFLLEDLEIESRGRSGIVSRTGEPEGGSGDGQSWDYHEDP